MPPQLLSESFPTFPSVIPVLMLYSVLVVKETLYGPGQDLRFPRV